LSEEKSLSGREENPCVEEKVVEEKILEEKMEKIPVWKTVNEFNPTGVEEN